MTDMQIILVVIVVVLSPVLIWPGWHLGHKTGRKKMKRDHH